jgi:hypothetical protein
VGTVPSDPTLIMCNNGGICKAARIILDASVTDSDMDSTGEVDPDPRRQLAAQKGWNTFEEKDCPWGRVQVDVYSSAVN